MEAVVGLSIRYVRCRDKEQAGAIARGWKFGLGAEIQTMLEADCVDLGPDEGWRVARNKKNQSAILTTWKECGRRHNWRRTPGGLEVQLDRDEMRLSDEVGGCQI